MPCLVANISTPCMVNYLGTAAGTNGTPVDDNDDDDEGDKDAGGDATATKKKKKKKKKKGGGGGGAGDGVPTCPGGVGSKPAPSRGVTGFTDSYVRCVVGELCVFFGGGAIHEYPR